MAFLTMPFLSPSFAGRSKRTTGTPALARCAAICAPMTPAPSTAAFLICSLFTRLTPGLRWPSGQIFANGFLVDLADAGARQRLDETDLVGHRVARDVAGFGEFRDDDLDLVGRRRLPRL